MTTRTSLIQCQLQRHDFNLNVNLQLPNTGITAIYGASGSGKTTLLRCVAGLEKPHHASITINNQVWQNDRDSIFIPTWQRSIGYVFQEPSLFAHLNVTENLKFASQRASSNQQSQQLLDHAIDLLGIEHLLQRQTEQLSVGEKQRVAIARALASSPQLLLLDEPLSALDQNKKEEVLPWLIRLRDDLKIPMLYVTHAMSEVTRLAQSLVILDRGQVHASGPIEDVLLSTGAMSALNDEIGALLTATVKEINSHWHLARIDFEGGSLWLRNSNFQLNQVVRVRVLAKDVSISKQLPQQSSIQNQIKGVIEQMTPDIHPSQTMIHLRCGQTPLLARITSRAVQTLGLQAGDTVWAQVKSVALV